MRAYLFAFIISYAFAFSVYSYTEYISKHIYFPCRLIAKYRPTMPVLSVVIPRLKTNQLKWSFTGAFEV